MNSNDQNREELILKYRQCISAWEGLLQQEDDLREEMAQANEEQQKEEGLDEETQTEPLLEELEEAMEDTGLRQEQKAALADLKRVEQALFACEMDRATTPEEKEEFIHLAQDYAGRITWLRKFLEEDQTKKNKKKKS